MQDGRHDIGITLGDPSGVGPELVASLIAENDADTHARMMIFADRPILERAFTQRTGGILPDTVRIVDRGQLSADLATPGEPSEAGAAAQVAYLEAAVNYARGGELSAIVTAPVSKAQCQRVGFEFPGQTEFFAERLGADRFAMLFVSPTVNVVLATTHVPLARVPSVLALELDGTIDIAIEALRNDLGIERPRVGVLGLNPHAGEGGLLGTEERDLIEPSIASARSRWTDRAHFKGPLVPDAAFRAPSLEELDLVVAMYHDQGLIPLKVMDFDHTVNVTIGLPIVRTSPDHGVAYDIAGKGVARPHSFYTAFERAAEMSARRASST